MLPTKIASATAVIFFAFGLTALADDDKDFVRRRTVNEDAGFMIRIDVDRPDRIYYEGETMTISMVAEKDCYVYLVYYNAENQIHCLFPSEAHDKNFVKAGVKVQIPAPNDPNPLVATAPFGKELLQVIATREPVDLFDGKALSRATPLKLEEVTHAVDKARSLERDFRRRPATASANSGQAHEVPPGFFAEAQLPLATLPGKRPRTVEKQQRRLGVCVGISNYGDPRIPKLHVCHDDARQMAEAFKTQCGLDEVLLLVNEQATLEMIRKAIYELMVQNTRPGDAVFLFFSGHGGRCADTNGDEADGLDEYLVPYDAEPGRPETMLLDDMFARWIAALDGRQVFIMLDNCYSGGSSKGVRQELLGDVKGLDGGIEGGAHVLDLDFLDGELKRAKDLGQKGTAVLAASRADQIAWEMSNGKGSVLTYFVVQALGIPDADTDHDGRVSVKELYDTVKLPVARYVKETFNARQDPILLDNDSNIVLRQR
jgi:hypothetical protein